MNPRPRLIRSIPFWILIAASLASAVGGAYLLLTKLGTMDVGLIDGTATTSDVYVGQIWGVTGAILVGAGVVGLLLALSVASLRAFVPAAAPVADAADTAVTAPADATAEPGAPAEPATESDLGYDAELGYAERERAITH